MSSRLIPKIRKHESASECLVSIVGSLPDDERERVVSGLNEELQRAITSVLSGRFKGTEVSESDRLKTTINTIAKDMAASMWDLGEDTFSEGSAEGELSGTDEDSEAPLKRRRSEK